MPTKKLSALAVPTLPPGEWRDAALPGLILRVGARRRTWTFRARVVFQNRGPGRLGGGSPLTRRHCCGRCLMPGRRARNAGS